ncbi:ORF6N domain-containing protein [Coprobacillus sp. AF15-30]|nr:ORF6N domain-containing protein [Coprobacillus sp. AF15-30]
MFQNETKKGGKLMNLQVIELQKQRVLLTQQLADSYGTDNRIISNNFARNKERYQEGKHYFLLQGEVLKDFKTSHQFDDSLKRVNQLYLWTERGAFLHAKSLNTDKA